MPITFNNLSLRIITALVTIPVIVLIIFSPSIFLFLFVLIVTLACVYEISRMVHSSSLNLSVLLNISSSMVLLFNAYFTLLPFLYFILVLFLLLFIIELFLPPPHFQNFSLYLISLFFVSLPLSSLFYIKTDLGNDYLLFLFILIWISDIFGYFGGRLFGGYLFTRKFFPVHSPKKTWEGYIFSLLATLSTGALYGYTNQTIGLTKGIILSLAIGTLSPLGDLFESMIKRELSVKDSSNFIPGHGGFFDRFDAFCFGAPVFWIANLTLSHFLR